MLGSRDRARRDERHVWRGSNAIVSAVVRRMGRAERNPSLLSPRMQSDGFRSALPILRSVRVAGDLPDGSAINRRQHAIYAPKRRARKTHFAHASNMFAVFKPPRENNSLFRNRKSGVCFARPARQEGRYGQSSPDAARDAVDAKRARRGARRERRNRAVPIPRRWNQASCDEREATVANRQGTPRRPRISRNPLRGECRLFRLPCEACVREMHFLLHARPAGAASIRCSPRPLCERRNDDADLGR
jgi:hypothetical protein